MWGIIGIASKFYSGIIMEGLQKQQWAEIENFIGKLVEFFSKEKW